MLGLLAKLTIYVTILMPWMLDRLATYVTNLMPWMLDRQSVYKDYFELPDSLSPLIPLIL